jgi:hypothetical protein
MTSGSGGVVKITLQIPGSANNASNPSNLSAASGNNYVIEAGFDSNLSTIVTPSSTITAWKRVYIEQDMMFKRGALLFTTYDPGAACGSCNSVDVYSWGQNTSSFSVKRNDTIVFFDDTYSTGDPSTNSATEKRKVTNVSIPAGSNVATITFKNPSAGQPDKLTKIYQASNRDSSGAPIFTSGHSAAIGVVGAGFYTTPLPSTATFDQAYIEIVGKPSDSGVLPYLPREFFLPCLFNVEKFHQAWFKNSNPTPCSVLCGTTQFNGSCNENANDIFHLMGITAGQSGAGSTDPNSNSSFIYSDSIYYDVNGLPPSLTPLCTGNNATCTNEFNKYMTSVVNHETGHQFSVNAFPPCAADRHDGNRAWCGNPGTSGAQNSCVPTITGNSNCTSTTEEWCVMNGSLATPAYYCQRIDGVDQFDCSDLIGSICTGVTQNCSGTPPQSLRTISDPQ